MKKHITLLILLSFGLFFIANQNLFGQFERMEIKYSIEEIVVEGKTVYNVDVTVSGQSNKIIFSLYKDSPIPENLVEESKATKKNTIRFENLPVGTYSVIVYEGPKKGGFESIVLGN